MSKILKNMYCEDINGEYELWFDENDKLVGGYFCNDAVWRDEYFNDIFESIDVTIKNIEYNEAMAMEASKELWGFHSLENPKESVQRD